MKVPFHRHPLIPWYHRVLLAVGGLTMVGLLVTAAMLKADSRGYGTHQQLGLPPCTFKQIFGLRCPSCGMTTSWALLTHGRVLQSIRSNLGGTLLGVVTMIVGPWSLASGLRGRWLGVRPNEWMALSVTLTVMGVTLIDWCVRLLIE